MDEEKKEEEKEEVKEISQKKSNLTETVRENPWILATFVCGILVVILLISTIFGGFTGKVISADSAGEKFMSYLEEQGANIDDVTITGISSESGLYEIYFNYQNEPYPIPYYMTKDGKFVGMMSAITETSSEETSETQQTEVPKSNKPIVELFVMSYCPYGTQAEKGIIPAVELLGDKIDFKIRYVDYTMHGEKEVTENLREYCIEKIAPEKFLDYMICFLEGDGVESNGYITNGNDVNACLTLAGIDKGDLETCMAETDTEFLITENLETGGNYPKFNVDAELNDEYGVQGSPTLVINGVQVSSSRDSESYLNTICSAFKTAPTECSTQLSSEIPSPYFGWDSTGSSTTASCG
jgi:glutaredoxin